MTSSLRSNCTSSLRCLCRHAHITSRQQRPGRIRWSSTTTQPQPPSFNARRAYFAASSLAIVGAGFGYLVNAAISPPLAPPAGSEEDGRLIALLTHDMDNLPVMRDMRGDDSWTEIVLPSLQTGSIMVLLAGSGRVGVHRSFWNATTHEYISVLWLGTELCGWPGLAHGGAIATLVAETSQRAVLFLAGPNAIVKDGAKAISVTYKKPTEIGRFYIVRARPSTSQAIETGLSPARDGNKRHEAGMQRIGGRPLEIDADLETLDGKVCVAVKTIWDV